MEEDIHSLKRFMVVLMLLCGFDLSFRFLAGLYLVSVQQKNKKNKTCDVRNNIDLYETLLVSVKEAIMSVTT